MLAEAARLLQSRAVQTPYEMVLVDELQDTSAARGKIIAGLLRERGRLLLGVGDDWQAINRFAGADLGIMRRFHDWFGEGPTLALTTTHRCTQTICDVAAGFAEKNPAQLSKQMRSTRPDSGPEVRLVVQRDRRRALREVLNDLSAAAAAGELVGRGPVVTVDVLGRYRFEQDAMPARSPAGLRVTFRTVHAAKGLEADVVVVPNLVAGTYGFPSTIVDDPVLALVMPEPETFEHAEERRLFYVALTRARHHVILTSSPGGLSPFAIELLRDPALSSRVIAEGEDGTGVVVCPGCGLGCLEPRVGPFGQFFGCSRYPSCTTTRARVTGDRTSVSAE